MIIETKLEFNEYIRMVFLLTFKKPILFVIPIMLFLFLSIIIANSDMPKGFESVNYIYLFFSLFLVTSIVSGPLFIYYSRKKWFYSSNIQESITYEFTNDKMIVKGQSFISEINWSSIYKIDEHKDWILIYQNMASANFISKKAFGERLNEFKSIVSEHKNIQLNFK